jgi:hypothetical protein
LAAVPPSAYGKFFIKCCDIQDRRGDVTQHEHLETGIRARWSAVMLTGLVPDPVQVRAHGPDGDVQLGGIDGGSGAVIAQ